MTEPVKKRGRPKNVDIVNQSNLSDETVNEIVKKKKTKNKNMSRMEEHHEPGDMSKLIMNSMGLRQMGSEQIDMKDPKAIQQRIDNFIAYCIERDMKPTVESMALAFGTDRVSLWRMKEGHQRDLPESCRKELKRGYDLMNQLLTQIMSDGKINPVSAIFLLKNNHAYRDQTEVVVSPHNPYENDNPDDIRDKYIEGVPNEVDADGTVE